jgi:hypothetical protein
VQGTGKVALVSVVGESTFRVLSSTNTTEARELDEEGESTFRVLSSTNTTEARELDEEGESTFRVLSTTNINQGRSHLPFSFYFFTCLKNDLWIEIKFVFVVLSATQSLVPFIFIKESKHIEVRKVILDTFQ